MELSPDRLSSLQSELSIPATELTWLVGVSRTTWYRWVGTADRPGSGCDVPAVRILLVLLRRALRRGAPPAHVRRLMGLELGKSGSAVRRWERSEERRLQTWAYLASMAFDAGELRQASLPGVP